MPRYANWQSGYLQTLVCPSSNLGWGTNIKVNIMSSKYDTDDYKLTFSLTWTRVTPKENCSSCNGTGKLYSNEKNLSPEIPQALIDDLAAAWKKHNSPLTFCNDCNGTGEYGPYMCERCDGTGE